MQHQQKIVRFSLITFIVIVHAVFFWAGPSFALDARSVWLEFDGKDDVVQVGDSVSLDLTNHMTVESWIRADSVPGTGGQARVASKSFSYEITVYSADTGCISGTQGDVQWRAVIGGLDRRICGGWVTPGMWHHVAGTYDGSRFILYVDGNQVANVSRSGLIETNNYDLNIGNHPFLARPFDGDIDEVRIWNIARTREQIQNDMHWELSGSEPGLVAYYKFNEGSGQSAFRQYGLWEPRHTGIESASGCF
jgi:hypothetical protein